MPRHMHHMTLSQKSIGAGIRLIREEADLMAKELAEAAGVAPSQISEVEKGRKKPSENFMRKVASALQTTPEELEFRIASLAEKIDTPPAQLRISEPSASYRASGKVLPVGEISDFEALARYFAEKLTRDEIFELIHEFTLRAKNGDRLAAQSARALLLIDQP